MPRGIDTSTPLTQDTIDCLKQSETPPEFIGRYYGFDLSGHGWKGAPKPKCLTFAEAELISMNDLKIVALYQYRGNRLEDFAFESASRQERGSRDAKAAHYYARYVIHQPQGSAIYFAVDFDVPAGDMGPIKSYFCAVKEVFNRRGNYYRLGVYGSGAVCRTMADATLVDYTWIAQAGAWNGTAAFADAGTWTIQQGAQQQRCNIPVDDDEARVIPYGEFIL